MYVIIRIYSPKPGALAWIFASLAEIIWLILALIFWSVRKDHQAKRQAAAQAARFGAAMNLTTLSALSPKEFEFSIAALLAAAGYTQVRVIGGSGDLAADISGLTPGGERFIAQCKRYRGKKVGSPEIQTFIGMGHVHHRVAHLLYFTTSDFTSQAVALAWGNVDLFGGEQIVRWATTIATEKAKERQAKSS
jgi:restriction endonuclease Mrr